MLAFFKNLNKAAAVRASLLRGGERAFGVSE
jgi:hypothetical protein